MNEFGISIDQVDFTGRQDFVFYAGEYRRNDLLRGTDDCKTKQRSLPEILVTDLGTAGRKAITTACQQLLNHAALLLEILRPMQTHIHLQYPNHHRISHGQH